MIHALMTSFFRCKQGKIKCTAFSLNTFGPNAAFVGFDEVASDGETQPGAAAGAGAISACAGAVRFVKPFKDAGEIIRGDADAGIVDFKEDFFIPGAGVVMRVGAEGVCSACGGELSAFWSRLIWHWLIPGRGGRSGLRWGV